MVGGGTSKREDLRVCRGQREVEQDKRNEELKEKV